MEKTTEKQEEIEIEIECCSASIVLGHGMGTAAVKKIFKKDVQEALDDAAQISYVATIMGSSMSLMAEMVGNAKADAMIKDMRDQRKANPKNETVQ